MTDRDKLVSAIAKAFKKDIGEITDETRLKEDLNATSALFFSIIAVIEELTGKKVKYSQLRKLATVKEICDFMESLKA